ncbi:ADP-ribosyltransferase domain-containing protein, partial [Herbaspirillum sp. B65]
DWNALTSEPSSRLGEVGTNRLNRDLDDVQAGISGLQKLPHYNQGRVYRGEGGNIDKYRVGDLVSYQKFLSTSKTYSDSFAPGKNITIVIDDIRTGRDVQLISNQDQEREVLFPPYAKFVVTRVEDRRRAGGQYQGIWVYMNEI